MDIILLEPVRNLGRPGEQVAVKNGFARNFLLPQGKAVVANADNVAVFEARREEIEKQAAEKLAAAQSKAEQLNALVVAIVRKASDEGRLFGSVTPRDLARAISDAGVEVQKSEVHLPEGPIRDVGEHAISVALHSEVAAQVTVTITAE